jgi:hypothetical protein
VQSGQYRSNMETQLQQHSVCAALMCFTYSKWTVIKDNHLDRHSSL